MPSITKDDFKNDLASVVLGSVGGVASNATLTDDQQAEVLNNVIAYIENHCYVVNPNVKQTPAIKIKA